jgi:hypothetical protein
VLWFLLWPAVLGAQSFQQDRQGTVWKQGKYYIRFDRGRWTAGVEGGKCLGWHTFLWHDRWVYETLPGGPVHAGPTLDDDGRLRMSGLFSAREGSSPMGYAYRITLTPEGVLVRCELHKTGPLPLTNGIWLHIHAARDGFSGDERVWVRPCWHGALRSAVDANGDAVFFELGDGRSLVLRAPGYHAVNSEGSPSAYMFRFHLRPGDFEPGEKAGFEYSIAFTDLPKELPGEIKPRQEPLAIRQVTASADRLPQFGKLELSVDLGASYDNPYDPDQVSLEAEFHPPSGRPQVVPGFFMVRYKREVIDRSEVMVPLGNGQWKVRFAPRETGRYTWRLKLADRTGRTRGGEGQFEALPAKSPGFIGRSQADPHYLAFDNGQGFFAIGHNLPIYHTSGQLGAEAMRKFAAGGENFNRWWMSSSGFGIEWMDRLGWYRQDAAARIDLVLDLAGELGLYYMMCMDTHQDFREQGWQRNPYNVRNGGPCRTPGDWFTDPRARRLYRKRLRYTVARWGYSPHVLCWEFGNEVEGWADSPDAIKLPWHKEMAGYLRGLDPFRHLITTSFWSQTGPEEYWKLDNLDIVQTHCYTNDDGNVADPVRRYSLHQWEKFNKPHLFGEFGIRSHATTADKDPLGWGIHNALWAGLFSFCAGGPMPWWHEDYLDTLDLYFHFASLARFTHGLPLGSARWEPLPIRGLPLSRWGRPEHDQFLLQPDGTFAGDRRPQQLLHGQFHADLKHEPHFTVRYPAPGKFVARIGTVSAGGLLRIWLDGRQVLEEPLPCGQGPGKHSVYQPQWKLWETTYDQDVAIDVPAGEHRIHVENLGRDWVTVTKYTFTGCQVLDRPNLLACGMKTTGLALVWVQNKDSSWFNHAAGKVGQVAPSRITVEGLPDGNYRVQWWSTWRSRLHHAEQVVVRSGKLRLTVPSLKTDVALKIRGE